MTLLGKFFTVTIALLATVFMVLALAVNASHRNWRNVVLNGTGGEPGLKSQIESMTRVNEQLRDEKDRVQASLDREQAARRTALASLATQLDQLRGELQQSETQVQQLTAQVTELVQVDKNRVDQLQQLTAEATRLREQVLEEQQVRDELLAQLIDQTNTMNELRGLKLLLEERNEQLASQVTRFEEVVAAKGININDPLDGSPPERNGQVLRVDRPSGLALISIGYDEGLRVGHTLEVTRDGRYVTRLKVRKADEKEPDRAVAEIMKDYSEGVLREGDRVDTSLE